MTADWIALNGGGRLRDTGPAPELIRGTDPSQNPLSSATSGFRRFPSPTSYVVVRVALAHTESSGRKPARHPPAGSDLCGPSGQKRPSRCQVRPKRLRRKSSGKSARPLVCLVPTKYSVDHLVLLSKTVPPSLFGNAQVDNYPGVGVREPGSGLSKACPGHLGRHEENYGKNEEGLSAALPHR